jgi:hypothetical protein
MYSYFWNLINVRTPAANRRISYLSIVLFSLLFALPRYQEAWFFYAVIAYPLLVIGILGLTKRLLPLVMRVQSLSLTLAEKKKDQDRLQHWWNSLDRKEHFLWSLIIACALAGLSLAFNANPNWSRYTDALGIFYIGFMVGDVFYLLILVQSGIYQLRELPLRLNPLDPANTVDLRRLAETTFTITISIGFSLLALNIVIAVASYLFRHLLFGVIVISVLAWATVILLSIYPHLIFWQLVQARKHDTLRMLEEKIFGLYLEVKEKSVVPANVEDLLKLQSQVIRNRSFPISNSELFSILSTLFLNAVPLLLSYFKIDVP